MSWMEDILDKFRQQAIVDQQQMWVTSSSSHPLGSQTPMVCDFCNKAHVDNLPFGNARFNDWIMCNECNEKLKKRVKLILKFE